MNDPLSRVISSTTPLTVAIRRLDDHRSLARIELAGKIQISNIRIKTKGGRTRVFWPTTPENARDRNGRPLGVFPIVRILDDHLRRWLEDEILKSWRVAQLAPKAQAQRA